MMAVEARIASIRQETPTVKSFALDLGGQEFHFLPGQWVDCYVEVDGQIEFGGYSLTSSPLEKGTLELAVKQARESAAAHFLLERARVGDRLYVDGGQGDFFFAPGMGESLLLIAGGIGINPLMSILRFVDEGEPQVRSTLLYSAKTTDELLFRDRLNEMAGRNSRIRCLFTVTQPAPGEWTGLVGRIDGQMLRDAKIDRKALCYVCGPPDMVDSMIPLLEEVGVAGSQIKYERWW